MIYLVTGQPGAGKSLYAISTLVDELVNASQGRQVYFSGIKDCMVPGWIEIDNAEQWHSLPDGAIVVMDECQRTFRMRATGAAVPEWVSQLETHRHRGFDLILITQHPMLLDTNVRRLIGNHRHVQRRFGMQSATVHEWHELKTEPDKTREGSIRHSFMYPVSAFKLYKSAEVHTHKRRIPRRVFLLFAIPVLILICVIALTKWWQGRGAPSSPPGKSGQTLLGAAGTGKGGAPAAGVGREPTMTLGEFLALRVPLITGLPHTAPVYAELTKPKIAPELAACLSSAERGCRCFSQQGTHLDVPADLCEQIVAKGYFVDWRDDRQERRERSQPAELRPPKALEGPGAPVTQTGVTPAIAESPRVPLGSAILPDTARPANIGRKPLEPKRDPAVPVEHVWKPQGGLGSTPK